MLEILSHVTCVPSAPILTGQAGTTEVPDAMEVCTTTESSSEERQRMEDAYPDARLSSENGTGVEPMSVR